MMIKCLSLKNLHGVEPTRYMKREDNKYGIRCDPNRGLIFGDNYTDILIRNICNKEDRCSIWNDGTRAYKCHPKYKKSLFVNTAGPDERNEFTVLD